MKVVCINLPHTIYTVSENTGSNAFLIGKTDPSMVVDISSGSYSGVDMAGTVTTALSNITDFSNVTLEYSKITGKMTFCCSGNNIALNFDYIDPSACPNTFSQTGSNIYKDQLTLGWLLGFRQNYKYRTPLYAGPYPQNCNIFNQLTTSTAKTSTIFT